VYGNTRRKDKDKDKDKDNGPADIQSGNRSPLVSMAKGMIRSPATKAAAVVATGIPRLP
jgi:hypothetical protein